MDTGPEDATVKVNDLTSNSQGLETRIEQLKEESAKKANEISRLRQQKAELDRQLIVVSKETEELLDQKAREECLLECSGDELAAQSHQLSVLNETTRVEQNTVQQEIDELRQAIAKYDSQLLFRKKAVDTLSTQSQYFEDRYERLNVLQTEREVACRHLQKKVRETEKVIGVPSDDLHFSGITLGKGVYGVVYMATWQGSTVAVKKFASETLRETYLGRAYQSEIVQCSKHNHANIATVYAFNRDKYCPLVAVMEILQGSLCDVLEFAVSSGPYLTLREQLDVTRDCLRGLQYLHSLPTRVVHCDVRPTNILLTPTMKAKICDLGEARLTDMVWFHVYCSPERAENRPLTPATDVFSIGLTMCEMYSGVKPEYSLKSRKAVLEAVPRSDLHDICAQMVYWIFQERISVLDAKRGIEHVMDTPDYWNCPPKRMVKGLVDGVGAVTLVDRPSKW